MAVNPSVLQPGLLPDVISLRPASLKLRSYSQRLRKPSGGLPVEIRWSLSSETIPATACTLAVSCVVEDGR